MMEPVIIFVAFAAVVYFFIREDKRRIPADPTPAPVPEPMVTAPFEGTYVFDIVPPDRNAWGEGKHPDEIAGTAHTRSDWAPGLRYRLEGPGTFDRSSDGRLKGEMIVCGARCRINVDVPINGGAVGFLTDGVYAEFHFDGKQLRGIVFEPHDKQNKYGNVVGKRL